MIMCVPAGQALTHRCSPRPPPSAASHHRLAYRNHERFFPFHHRRHSLLPSHPAVLLVDPRPPSERLPDSGGGSIGSGPTRVRNERRCDAMSFLSQPLCGVLFREALLGAVAVDVVGGVGVPAGPDDPHPGAHEDPDGLGVTFAALTCSAIELGGPGGAVAAVVGERGEGGNVNLIWPHRARLIWPHLWCVW